MNEWAQICNGVVMIAGNGMPMRRRPFCHDIESVSYTLMELCSPSMNIVSNKRCAG